MQIESLVRPNILKMKPYSSARDEFKGRASVFLDANENPYDNGLNRYPDPLAWAVKEALTPLKGVPPSQIFLGNGSDEAIDVLMRIFCVPQQDNILILPPTYGMYQVSAETCDVALREVPLTADFQPDVPAILAAADANSKILFLCSPNNPTGNAFEATKIETLLANFKGIVVVDEAYIDFSSQPSALHWLAQYPNLVVMQTFSKAWGLAAVRLGMAFASETIIGLMNKVKPPYNINLLTQKAALTALEKTTEQAAAIREILQERATLAAQLEGLSCVKKIHSSDANFLLVEVADPNATYRFLLEKGIVVRNRHTVLLCEGCLRLTVGTPAENKYLVEMLTEFSK